jgi:ribonuclease E
MTLAVLRLIGEELRKDRTIRVIAQLPVEVATYLFNEKREWLRTLEDRSSAELIIVPNPNIQTPEYSIRRIRDDEIDLPENRQTSYLMPTAPQPVEPGSALDKRPPAEVPAVAALLPSTPAPILAHPPTVAAAAPAPEAAAVGPRGKGGLGTWFKKLFTGESEAAEPVQTAAPAPAASSPASGSTHHHRSSSGGDRRRDGRREHSRQPRRPDGGQRRGHGDGRRAEGGGGRGRDGRDGRDRDRREHDRDQDRRPPRDLDIGSRPAEAGMSAAPTSTGGDPRPNVEAGAEPRQGSGDRMDRGERGERRGRRRGRRGGRHGGGGAGREGGARESAGFGAGAPAAAHEAGASDFSAGAPSNGAERHQHEPPVTRESVGAPEPREFRESHEPRESRESHETREPRESHHSRESHQSRESHEARESREATSRHEAPAHHEAPPPRHEAPAAPLAHFEPTPATESNAQREAKPYVVWSSAPPDRPATGGTRGSEE